MGKTREKEIKVKWKNALRGFIKRGKNIDNHQFEQEVDKICLKVTEGLNIDPLPELTAEEFLQEIEAIVNKREILQEIEVIVKKGEK